MQDEREPSTMALKLRVAKTPVRSHWVMYGDQPGDRGLGFELMKFLVTEAQSPRRSWSLLGICYSHGF